MRVPTFTGFGRNVERAPTATGSARDWPVRLRLFYTSWNLLELMAARLFLVAVNHPGSIAM